MWFGNCVWVIIDALPKGLGTEPGNSEKNCFDDFIYVIDNMIDDFRMDFMNLPFFQMVQGYTQTNSREAKADDRQSGQEM